MSSERVKETKEKVLNWLKEEAFSPQEISDSQAYFNIGVMVSGLTFHVVQNVHNIDSFFVGANLVLTEDQLKLVKDMNAEKRQEFFWVLRLALLENGELGDFQIKPNPPDDFKEVFIASRRIFYDALTKDRLISAISSVHRAVVRVIWMLERYAGVVTPKMKKGNQKIQYSV